jgi:hypothetical protein
MTVKIHNKEYVTVAERVQMVHESKKDFEILESVPFAVGDRWLWRVVARIDGKQYVGTAEAKISNARKGSPDDSNPFECAETSALGRCLGFAGFGSVESIASADEIVRSQPRAQVVTPTVNGVKRAANAAGLATSASEWAEWKKEMLGQDVADEQLTDEHLSALMAVAAAA